MLETLSVIAVYAIGAVLIGFAALLAAAAVHDLFVDRSPRRRSR